MPVKDKRVSLSDARHAPAFTASSVWDLCLLSFLHQISAAPPKGLRDAAEGCVVLLDFFVDSLFAWCFQAGCFYPQSRSYQWRGEAASLSGVVFWLLWWFFVTLTSEISLQPNTLIFHWSYRLRFMLFWVIFEWCKGYKQISRLEKRCFLGGVCVLQKQELWNQLASSHFTDTSRRFMVNKAISNASFIISL